ncbi:hypothetical protein Pcinc_026851 [Petrolisthes cinctipes]|uniref:Cyanophycinase n=1 Tax=Petrolisthes cinctipes TaxID=88211 RepID=A0AAE1F542_PETCI|nr:hypothetical protein Pcinc_026851 [Petrolisthes cinctipes]
MRGVEMVLTVVVLCGLGVLLGYTEADLVLAGGGLADDNADVYGTIVDLAGGPGVANIGIITTASADPLDSATFYQDLFINTYGAASATWISVTETSGNADTQEIYDLVMAQTGLFLGGGDQARIMTAWRRPNGTASLGMSAIIALEAGGGVVAGSSAGAACQGAGPMIEGGLSYQALRYGAYAGGYNPDYPDDLCYDELGGLGLLPGYIVDTHFSERGREGRLIKLLLDTGFSGRGLGVDENSAVHIDSNGTAKVLGTAGGVLVVDVSSVEMLAGDYSRFNNARVSFYSEGDVFSTNNDGYMMAEWKTDLTGNEYAQTAPTSSNIFSSPDANQREYGVFREMSTQLWDSKQSSSVHDSYEKNPTFVVTLNKSDGIGYGGYSSSTAIWVLSYHRMAVDIDYM